MPYKDDRKSDMRNAVSSQFINIHEYQLESEGVGVNCVCPTASFICPVIEWVLGVGTQSRYSE